MSRSNVTTAMGDAIGCQLAFESVTEVTGRPRVAVVVWKIDAAIVPGIAVSVEAACRFNRDQ